MIYTVTFNPALDYVISVDHFTPGKINRTVSENMICGGKGINVSALLANLGYESTALGFVAGFIGVEIEKRAKELGSPAFALTEDMYEMQKNTREGIDFSFHCKYYNTVQLSIPYIASYQMMNASLAFFTMEQLRDVHKIPLEKLIEGLKNTHWEGRMETVLPDVIVDGAHNADGVARFVETACHFGKEHPITLLFSAVADKDYEKMIRTVSEKIRPRAVVATEVGGSRVVPATELAEFFKEDGCEQVIAEANVGEAFEKALSLKGDGMLFCVGSLYLVGEIKEYLQKNPEA